MSAGVYLSYSDLFDCKPTIDELIDLLKPIPLRHAIYVLSRINLGLRYAMQELGRSNFAEVQGFFMSAHSDDEMLWRLKLISPMQNATRGRGFCHMACSMYYGLSSCTAIRSPLLTSPSMSPSGMPSAAPA